MVPRENAVWVTVYVERPERRRLISNTNQQQQQQRHHHDVDVHRANRAARANGRSSGRNRKAQLLDYTRQLRDSARSQSSSPLLHPKPASHSISNQQQRSITHQMFAVRNSPKVVATPNCLRSWKFLTSSFMRSSLVPRNKKKSKRTNDIAIKIKAVMKSFRVHKNGGNFMSKMLQTLKKRGSRTR